MTSLKDQIAQKLNALPEASLRKVLDFVESLEGQASSNGHNMIERGLERDSILTLAGTLSFEPVSSRDIDDELYGPHEEEK